MTTVADLEAMDRGALCALWSRQLKRPVPAKMSRDMLRRILAFELQSARHGGLSARTRRELGRIGREDTRRPGRSAATMLAAAPSPGTRLVREWNGTTHIVEMTADGVQWDGRTYRSLSAVAREITGARWSGPRFFGLTGTGR